MNCPVCNKEMEYQNYCSSWGVEEYESKCPDGCYYEQFSYGSTQIHIAGVMLGYYYDTPEKERKYIKKQIDMLAQLEREYRANGNEI